ncbi:MAG: hypothetical protein ABIN36_19280 [Ferruginibacter sp.]
MASTNLFSIEFSDADLKKINTALLMLEETFAGKLINDISSLSKVPELEIENLSDTPSDDATMLTLHLPAFANISQWDKDETARQQLQPIATRLKSIAQQVVYTNRAVLQRCWNSSSKYGGL